LILGLTGEMDAEDRFDFIVILGNVFVNGLIVYHIEFYRVISFYCRSK